MHVETKKLLDFLAADGAKFSIPLFQRPYSWEQWQCEIFWNDIERSAHENKSHFFGAVFYRKDCIDEETTLSLIDGQQRTLTSLLLLAALAERVDAANFADTDLNSAYITQTYLRSNGGIKVQPSKCDEAEFLRALNADKSQQSIDSEDSAEQRHNAIANKTFFAVKMAAADFDPLSFWKGLNSFEVVVVELEDGDNAQSIFESFNSKGVPLVAADMARNYLLLAESEEEQKRLYVNYWEPIQGLFGDDPGSLRLNNALRAWTVIRCKTPKAKNDSESFNDFKQYFVNEYDGTSEDLMEELLSFCIVWAENYRYHAVKKYRSSNWAKIGRKTLVSDRPLAPSSQQSRDFYSQHYGIEVKGE
ncbi:DUF262 domain-containing protein [Adlercreutzia sp. ZJ154]|uniref:DUF262 domain-containing protein n=1 Tax=Adlercreutzia sp. ZJ154 TaxID=2709790 RepID=UPI0013EC7868|nr:DUF262 domain-containing protein [Adlercreutzia sp. ZJ154]